MSRDAGHGGTCIETGGSLSSRPTWFTNQVSEHPGLQRNPASKPINK